MNAAVTAPADRFVVKCSPECAREIARSYRKLGYRVALLVRYEDQVSLCVTKIKIMAYDVFFKPRSSSKDW